MSKSLADYFNKGLSPSAFMAGMTKNKEEFLANYEGFAWPNEEQKEFFESLGNRDDLRCLIISADWCGDALRSVPVVFRAMEAGLVPTEVLIIEENYELLDQHLTLGGRSIPIVLITDTGGYLLGKWGPRPANVQQAMIDFKAANPDREAADYQDNLAETRKEIIRRYGEQSDYAPAILAELQDILSSF
ncbi:thioredoxin family protein [Cohnella sp. AR92]|uniref:thioredoxin family protein n=1 Tax=Cohnella sp. AR92 TaxID=648716 RepID=UPI000F8CCB5C|nr:thioredoxin family protein [Cohnella sp. AR92]RUS42065.1 thioredoxin family protein [Cohnella sp. AR92]